MSATWVNLLKESDSRLQKEDVIRKALTNATLGDIGAKTFLTLTRMTYSPYITFGIKQIEDTVGITDAENPWAEYMVLLQQLSSRELTGNAAKDAVFAMSQRFNSDEWNTLCAPVIRKDLRAGVSDKTVNKICKKTEYEIPIFGCQLASSCENRPEMKGIKRLEPKLDGVRVLLMVIYNDQGDLITTCYSRNGKIFENFSHIEEQIHGDWRNIVRAIGSKYGGAFLNGFVLDGEVVGNSFQELMRQARRKENAQAEDSVFHVFDILPLDDFGRGFWNTQLHKRIGILNDLRSVINDMPNVELLPHIDVDLDTAAGKDQFDRYCKDMVEAGFEGVMIKSLDAPYECTRSTFWLKYKPVITVDLEVIDVEEGTGRNKGRLGALVCAGVDDGRTIKVNVGSGFSDSDRNDYWSNRNLVIGKTAEILCDVITQNQDGTYSLRFPRFVRFRDDK
jgi:DNA ligase 1